MAVKILITGGARSGKSKLAEELTRSFGLPLCYLATAQALDDEMSERINRHRQRRGNGWETIEEPLMVPQTLARIDGIYSAILLDCVTLWLSNLLLSYDDNDSDTEDQVLGHIHRLAATLRGMSTPLVLVTNEVGQGIVPENRLARLYRDITGQANQILAATCDSVHVCISGIPLKLK
jgi:adenosylcobinamide kinase/adenosylcobinamide-phosphate guanylyltransferase